MRLTRESEVSECKCGGRTFLLPGCCVTHIFSGGSTVLFLCTVSLLSSHRFCTMIYSGWELPGIWLRENWTWFRTWPMVFFLQASYMCAQGSSISSRTKENTRWKGSLLNYILEPERHYQCFSQKATFNVCMLELPCSSLTQRSDSPQSGGVNFPLRSKDKENEQIEMIRTKLYSVFKS